MSFAAKKKWALAAIIALLAISSLAVGLLFSVKTGALDRRYSDAMERNLRAVFLARDLSRNAAEAHRALINLAVEKGVSDPGAARQASEEAAFQMRKIAQMRAANDRLFVELDSLAEDHLSPMLAGVRELRSAYLEKAETLLKLLERGDEAAAAAYRLAEVRPAYDRYLEAQDRLADAILERAGTDSALLSAESRRWQRISIGLSGWPIGLAAFVVVAMVAALAWMLRGVKDESAT